MAYSVEKLLSDAATLVSRLKEHDAVADVLISHTGNLHKRIDAMKEYQDDITELNEIAKHRPRSHLIIGIAQENRQIRELQQENRELRMLLEEQQSATELIMKKYREQVNTLIETNNLEKAIERRNNHSKDMESLINKVCEMANVMHKSVTVDEDASVQDKERLTQLEIENRGLRELLEICSTGKMTILGQDVSIGDNSSDGSKTIADNPREPTVGNKPMNLMATVVQKKAENEKQETESDEKSGERTPQNEEEAT